MNNRLFLYSGLFLVIILLYDAWHNKNVDPSIIEQSIPETVVESSIPDSGTVAKPEIKSSSDQPATSEIGLTDSITVVTNSLEVKISLSDGSLVSSRLLK